MQFTGRMRISADSKMTIYADSDVAHSKVCANKDTSNDQNHKGLSKPKRTALQTLAANTLNAGDTKPEAKAVIPLKKAAKATKAVGEFQRDVVLMSCDTADVSDETAAVHYTCDIMTTLKRSERKHGAVGDYLLGTDISQKMRAVLCDWLVGVQLKFELREETLHLCLYILDRYLAATRVRRSELQLAACGCLWIASKYHEMCTPLVEDFVLVSAHAFCAQQLVECEEKIVMTLKFDFTVATPLQFAERFTKFATSSLKTAKDKRILSFLILYCLEHALLDYRLATAPLASQLAAAATCFAMCETKLINRRKQWNHFFATGFGIGFTFEELLPQMQRLHGIVKQRVAKRSLTTTIHKFKSSSRCKVAQFSFKGLDVSAIR